MACLKADPHVTVLLTPVELDSQSIRPPAWVTASGPRRRFRAATGGGVAETATSPVDGRGTASDNCPAGHLCGVRTSSVPRWVVRLQSLTKGISMNRNTRQTGSKAASAASTVLANKSSTKAEKSAAASALSQTPKKR